MTGSPINPTSLLSNVSPILASGGSGDSRFVLDLLVILGAAAVVSVLLRRLRLTSIPGYLLIGALVGALGLLSQSVEGRPDNIQQISDLAIVLLMFTIGMHLDLESIRSGIVRMILVGAGSTIAVVAVLWPLGMLFGMSAPVALVVAMGLSMSSTAVVLGILQGKREVHSTHGRLCIGISLVQDLLSVAVLAAMPLVALWATGSAGGEANRMIRDVNGMSDPVKLLSQALTAVGGIGAMLAFGHYVLPKLLRESGRGGNTEAMLVVSAAAALLSAVVSAGLGFGASLGAFLAGFLLSATPFRHQLAGQLAPMRDLFMAVFFTAVGAKMDLGVVASSWWIILLAVSLVLVVKSGMIGFAAWAGGSTGPISGLTALLLCQAGEFSLVVLGEAGNQKILDASTASLVIAVVVVSLIVTTPLSDWGRTKLDKLVGLRPPPWIKVHGSTQLVGHHTDPAPVHSDQERLGGTDGGPPATLAIPPQQDSGAETGTAMLSTAPAPMRVIIAGFGVVGRNLAEHLSVHRISFTVVEMNPSTVEKQIKLGRRAVFGDIANPDVLESAGIHDVDAVLLTIPDDEATLRACRVIRSVRADVFIAARTSYLSKAISAHELGADHVTVEEVVTAQDMAVKVIQQLARRATKPTTPHL